MLNDLADRVGLNPSDLVLEWKHGKIFYNKQSPLELQIEADEEVEMKCYEKAVYDKIRGVRQRARSGDGTDDTSSRTRSGETDHGPAGDAATADADAAETEAEVVEEKIMLNLSGKDGEIKINVRPDVTALSMLRVYAKKKAMGKGAENGLRLTFDGEAIAPDAMVKDMEVESGDMLEVSAASR